MTAQTFGRKGQGGGDEMARRREAFIAAERARQANPPAADSLQPEPRFGLSVAPASMPDRPPKSTGVAYLFWFLFGAVGAHRHYLGFHLSGTIQAGLWIMGWLALLSGNLYFLPAPFVAGLWMLADAFMIPGLCREANSRLRRQNVQHVFA